VSSETKYATLHQKRLPHIRPLHNAPVRKHKTWEYQPTTTQPWPRNPMMTTCPAIQIQPPNHAVMHARFLTLTWVRNLNIDSSNPTQPTKKPGTSPMPTNLEDCAKALDVAKRNLPNHEWREQILLGPSTITTSLLTATVMSPTHEWFVKSIPKRTTPTELESPSAETASATQVIWAPKRDHWS
jgi:hypothetical protein